ncbi:MAG: tRNA lysidine(34) synthetase TilS [Clostridia bacterium]|nr:tRNA lysidine(34) synthetase TilS [Clostridia bacterium]
MLPRQFRSPAELAGLPKDTPILVAFSGGADSTVLLHLLATEAKETGAQIFAAHVNHGIRGEEADRDEEFCRNVAKKLHIPIFVLHADVPTEAKKRGTGIEETARNIRYDYFDRLMTEHTIPLLATAHNANDNLETMLFHIARGSGLSGLCGIPISRLSTGGCIVRPLLSMTRAEILAYCKEHELNFVTDSTNVDVDYTRNRIRAEILPVLTEIHPAAIENAARLAETLRADARYLDHMATRFLEENRREASLECEKITSAPSAVAHRALMMLYAEISHEKTLEYTHLCALRRLAEKKIPHSSLTLPHGIEAAVENGWLCFRQKQDAVDYEPYEIALFEGENKISQTNCKIIIESSQTAKNIYKKSIQITIDSATIKGTLIARNRREGDNILLGGHHKSLKKLFTEKKIPPELRAKIPIFCDENGILAVPSIGIRDGSRITQKTTDRLTLTIDF